MGYSGLEDKDLQMVIPFREVLKLWSDLSMRRYVVASGLPGMFGHILQRGNYQHETETTKAQAPTSLQGFALIELTRNSRRSYRMRLHLQLAGCGDTCSCTATRGASRSREHHD